MFHSGDSVTGRFGVCPRAGYCQTIYKDPGTVSGAFISDPINAVLKIDLANELARDKHLTSTNTISRNDCGVYLTEI